MKITRTSMTHVTAIVSTVKGPEALKSSIIAIAEDGDLAQARVPTSIATPPCCDAVRSFVNSRSGEINTMTRVTIENVNSTRQRVTVIMLRPPTMGLEPAAKAIYARETLSITSKFLISSSGIMPRQYPPASTPTPIYAVILGNPTFGATLPMTHDAIATMAYPSIRRMLGFPNTLIFSQVSPSNPTGHWQVIESVQKPSFLHSFSQMGVSQLDPEYPELQTHVEFCRLPCPLQSTA
mmetsp:Transcript_4063/g.5473  ORF Transcript_4063/g.5473 Transcript_4063/m.5473 type:complete len:237 (+) Transcript_4063:1545-2255(+)